MNKGRHRV